MCLVLAIISIGLSVENREIKQEVHFCAWLLWHAFQFPPPELCHFFSLGWLPSPPSHSPRSLYEWGETLWVSQGLKPIKHFMNLLLWDIFLQTTGSLIPPPVPITEKYPLANNNTKRDELLLGKEELLPQVPSPPRQAPCGSRSHRLVLRTPPTENSGQGACVQWCSYILYINTCIIPHDLNNVVPVSRTGKYSESGELTCPKIYIH